VPHSVTVNQSAVVEPQSTTKEKHMGYYINLRRSEFSIPETEEVLQVLKDANWKFHDWKNGGGFGGEGEQRKWFSWMPSDYDKTVTSVAEVFTLLGFEVDSHDGVVDLKYYDSKAGQEDLFIALVAPFVEEGSFMEWDGEDGAGWRHEVVDGKLTIAEREHQYGNQVPYTLVAFELGERDESGGYSNSKWLHCDPYSIESPAEQYAAAGGAA
jgi:hypothetical protein